MSTGYRVRGYRPGMLHGAPVELTVPPALFLFSFQVDLSPLSNYAAHIGRHIYTPALKEMEKVLNLAFKPVDYMLNWPVSGWAHVLKV